MPQSRIRTKNGRTPKKSKADLKIIEAAYQRKFDEYEKMELAQLTTLRYSNKVKGTYLIALDAVIELKKELEKKAA